jgi:predicted lipid-binding transport protein (Tim44 family)
MSLDPLTVISALVALLVIWKLRSTLGQRTGTEKPPVNPFVGRSERSAGPRNWPSAQPQVARLPGAPPAVSNEDRWRPYAEPGTPLAAGLDAIAAADPAFSLSAFIEGARVAYERIVTAFACADLDTLKRLLAADVYDDFASALAARLARGDTLSNTFVSVDEARLEAATLDNKTARLDVQFSSKQIVATRDKDGTVVEGDADRVVDVEDVWAFRRDVTSRDPNWKLVATSARH